MTPQGGQGHLDESQPDRPNWRQHDETEVDYVRRMLASARAKLERAMGDG